MEIEFTPIDYEAFDLEDKSYVRVIGRSSNGKRVCLIDEFNIYFWAILDESLGEKKINNLIDKIRELKISNSDNKITNIVKVAVENKKFLGKDVKALKIYLNNIKEIQKLAESVSKLDGIDKVRENDLHFITRYIIEKKFSSMCKYKIYGEIIGEKDFGNIASEIDADIFLKIKNIEKLTNFEKQDFKPRVLAFDIETDDFDVGKGKILMISIVSENFKKVLTWKKISNIENFVESFGNEKEMLEAFVRYVKKISPDIITGYFSDSFDLPYLKSRAETNKLKLKLGINDSVPKFSGGMSPRGKISGIVHVDLYKFIDSAYSQYLQSETLGLNDVASELLGEKKKEHEFKHSSKMNDNDWKEFFEYNLQDSILTYNLFMKVWPDMSEFCKVMQEPLFNVSRDGMSSNVENYIIHNLEKYNEIIEMKPDHHMIEKRRTREKYEGAFVLQPTPKLYENIVMFDFTSYWPSIIATFNLSLSTYLGSHKLKEKNILEIDTGEKSGGKYYFSKTKGFFPQMLEEIIKKRKEYKEEFKKNPSPILKARSNAFKLLANASYGYQGFFGARYYCPEASAATTAISRNYIKKVIEKSEKEGFHAIYGDSVDGKTKVFVKKKGIIFETEIEKLFEKVDSKNSSGKEYDFQKNIEVLTLDDDGKSAFKPLVYVMRHNCDKKMYRVWFTNNWYIDVTEDHSLIGYQSTHFNKTKEKNADFMKRLIEIKPNEIKKKVNSIIAMKKLFYGEMSSRNYPKEVYEFMGYFVGDGSFMRNNSNKKFNKDYYLRLSLGKDGPEVFEKLINPLIQKGYLKSYWWSKSRKGDLTINGLKLINIISKDFCDSNGKKIIPDWLFDETEENIASFLRGLFSADGCVMIRNNAPTIKFTSIYDSYIESVRKLLYQSGISHSVFRENTVNKYKSKDKIYSSGSYSKNIILKNKEDFAEKIGFLLDRKNKLANIKTNNLRNKSIKNFEFDLQGVKKIEQIETSKYVYDIEVEESHKFFANYVLVHNTDSLCLELGKKSDKEALELLKKINENLPGIMELELEDFYKRGIWVTTRKGEFGAKKKYALINENGKMKIRGFETVRRDWCDLARELQNNVLLKILKEGNEKSAVEYTKDLIKKIELRKIEKEKLIIRTQLKKPLSEYVANTPHVTIARKMIKQGLPVNQGMLISYYIAESSDKKALTRERAVFVDDDKLYDIKYYLNKQILPAVENIFMVFGISGEDLIKGKKQKTLGDF